MVLLNRKTMLTTCCSLLVVVFRWSQYAALWLLLLAAYYCSSRQSLLPSNFQRSPFAAYSRLYVACFLLLTVRYSLILPCCLLSCTCYSLLAVCFLLLAACLVIFFRSSPLTVCCLLHITTCMLLFIPQLTNHSLPLASVCLPIITCQSVYAARLLLDTRCVLLVSRHILLFIWSLQTARFLLYIARLWLITGRYRATKTLSLINRSQLLPDVYCLLVPDRFSLLSSCFSLLGCVW